MMPASRDLARWQRTLICAALFVGLVVMSSAADASSDTYTIVPCRLVDTRNAVGPNGGPALVGNSTRVFTLAGQCGIPADAVGVWLTVTGVNQTSAGYLTIYPSDVTRPLAASLNFKLADGVITNFVFVTLASGGSGSVAVYDLLASNADHVDLVMDATAYVK